jgi:nicotinic acid mononucleotide adenylyltransferase
MKRFSDITEARGDTCVFTFGRFNPPTIGHEKLIEKVASEAKSVAGAPYYIFASHSETPKKTPCRTLKKLHI